MTQKNTFLKTIFLCLCTVWIFSCADDKGNYNYKELNDVEIKGLEEEIEVLAFTNLNITPEFGDFVPTEETHDFEWKIIATTGNKESQVIGTTRDLNYHVELLADRYNLLYTVKEKNSDFYYRAQTTLLVNSTVSEGWAVLCSDNNKTRLDFVSEITGETYQDILSATDIPQYEGPRAFQFLPQGQGYDDSPFYLFTDNGATRLSKNDFAWEPEFAMEYEMGTGETTLPYRISASGNQKMLVTESNVHYCDFSMGDGLFGIAINKTYTPAPAIGCNVAASNIYSPVFLMYDTEGKQFMYYDKYGVYPLFGAYESEEMGYGVSFLDNYGEMILGSPVVTGSSSIVMPVGEYDFKYMENTMYDPGNNLDGITYTILTKGNEFYLYGLQMGDGVLLMGESSDCSYIINKAYYGDLSQCTNISNASHFAFSSLRNYMYYAVGGQVYRVDLSKKTLQAEEQFNLPGEEITCLKFYLYTEDRNSNRSYDLIVGSQKAGDETSSGILRVYEGFRSEGNFKNAEPSETHEGFAKIVDVIYREISNLQ